MYTNTGSLYTGIFKLKLKKICIDTQIMVHFLPPHGLFIQIQW